MKLFIIWRDLLTIHTRTHTRTGTFALEVTKRRELGIELTSGQRP